MRVIELEEILTVLDESAALEAVASGFQRHARAEAEVPPPMHLAFRDPPGDCHVKAAAVMGEEVFVLKLATGFPGNLARGLAASNGFMAVVSARSGELPIELGALLAAPIAFGDEETVVADLTGVAIQDFEIARSVWQRLPQQ